MTPCKCQVNLVAKAPINRATRESCPNRDVLKRRTGNAMPGEDPLGRVENLVARLQRLCCRVLFNSRRADAWLTEARRIWRAGSR